jgi:RNA polymerase sigma-70 factor (ECF subfamily)
VRAERGAVPAGPAAAASGGGSAFDDAYLEHGALVAAVALRVVRSRSVAEEITHDVFLAYWQAPERLDPRRGSLRTLLCVMSYHRSIDWLRADESRQQREARWALYGGTGEPCDADVDRRTGVRHVRAALRQLPTPQRQAIEMVFYDELTHVEAARRLGVPLGTLKARVRIGIRRLAAALGPLLLDAG